MRHLWLALLLAGSGSCHYSYAAPAPSYAAPPTYAAPAAPAPSYALPTYQLPGVVVQEPSVTVVQVPNYQLQQQLMQTQLQNQQLQQQLAVASMYSPFAMLSGFNQQNSQQQPLQMMAMLHLMQSQGMSFQQQMQMLAMMQMAKRMGGRSVPVQPIFRTTAEYAYPGKKVIFWPPYISTQRSQSDSSSSSSSSSLQSSSDNLLAKNKVKLHRTA